MKNIKCILAAVAMSIASLTAWAAAGDPVVIPTQLGSYINWSNAVLANCNSENNGANVGSTHANTVVTFTLTNSTEQRYLLEMKTGARDLTAVLSVTVKNGETELYTPHDINIPNTSSFALSTQHYMDLGTLPEGTLTLEIKTKSTTGSYAGNWGDLALHSAAQYDRIPSESAIDLKKGTYTGCRVEDKGNVGYIKNGTSAIYNLYCTEDAFLNMVADIPSRSSAGQIKVTIFDAADPAVPEVQETFAGPSGNGNNQAFEIATPVKKGFKSVHLDFISEGTGYLFNYINLRFTKRADYDPLAVLALGSVTIDNEAVSSALLSAIKDNGKSYTLSGNIYTAVPVVSAKFNSGASATVTSVVNGTNVTYTLSSGEDFASTLIIEGVHVYAATGEEETATIKNGEGTLANGVWTNGVYTLTTTSLDGGQNGKFKLNGKDYTLTVPADVVVKQFIIKDFSNNYANRTVDHLVSVSSEGATTYIPTKNNCWHSTEGSPYDLVVNIEEHQAGTPIAFSFSQRTGQPLGWFQLTTTHEAPNTAPVKTAESITINDNDAVVALTFDRVIANDVTATIGDNTVTAQGGAATLYFTAWDLKYASNNTLTIAAGAVQDIYSNATTTDIEVAVNIPAKEAVNMAVYDYVVSTVEELTDAFTEVNASNTSATAARKTIFIKNGEYNLGTEVGTGKSLVQLKCYNVSLIGESRDGVIIHGETDGISNPVLNLRDHTGFYLQDLTVRNDYDYGLDVLKGVAVAIYGGDKTIMKNVRMLSNQDTQVTGHRAYFEDCDIHGTVDFICGAGDNYYYHTNLVLENRDGNVVAAPSTNASQRWGYVFDHCTIKRMEGATAVIDGSYHLGRPWQNEPRANFLHTTMEVLPAAAGWTKMSTLPTHFYEYDSRDGNGAVVELSGRTNSPNSTNSYTPVLTDEEAAAFTVRNVLGGTDAWDAAAMAAQVAAPANVTLNSTVIAWDAVEDAMLYVVLKDGKFLAQTTATTYSLTESGQYTVKAANRFGGLGAASASVTYNSTATSMENAEDHVQCTKILKDGQLLILRDGKTYTIIGKQL